MIKNKNVTDEDRAKGYIIHNGEVYKYCKGCASWKRTHNFSTAPSTKDLLQPKCKNCRARYDRERYSAKKWEEFNHWSMKPWRISNERTHISD